MNNTFLIFLFIAITAYSGYSLRLLTLSGSVAAFLIGLAVSLGFGLKGLLILGFFFASSSFWSKYKRQNKAKIEERHEKGSRRDWQQVAANGGTAALFSLLYYFSPHTIWIVGFSISIAAANSDTWASEIGSLSKRPPFFIRSWKRISAGTSGAVSLLGTIAAIIGAFLIAFLSFYFFPLTIMDAAVILLFGFLGNVIDTVFGAFLQAVYKCRNCGTEVEATTHCGRQTKLQRGLVFMNNDFVNYLSGFLAALLGILFIWIK
ncbi:uncharacterized protein (TIGR00297 family) [Cytobacillus eiseniae]|uniref:Uncharacterized protein (TIGR00297 family) n=1 Tax=Cytobacillus eiseniae TaxID=762947 RepID=A0ABS4RKD0_9BACI|nr:DUF92 domain-containing protein [Cytobacillus eiseniae]MBP2243369.1 uncharacterized protein (TIGR00297 family) [Cytobacillus eiseniae]